MLEALSQPALYWEMLLKNYRLGFELTDKFYLACCMPKLICYLTICTSNSNEITLLYSYLTYYTDVLFMYFTVRFVRIIFCVFACSSYRCSALSG